MNKMEMRMTRTASTIAVLAALAFVCLPLRADEDAFTLHLKEAVHQLAEHGQGLANDYPSSVMAQNLANLFSEIGNLLLLQNEQLETKKTPDEERIPILRQTYLQQMRRIHDMKPDGNSIALYHERLQVVAFYHESSPGRRSRIKKIYGFKSKLQPLLKIQESIGEDPAAVDLQMALQELGDKWGDFFLSPHQGEVYRILEREIVRPNPAGLWNPPPPTMLERFMGIGGLSRLMERIDYELTKLDVELAEQKTPLKERAKKLRNLFFEMIRKVEYIGLEVQVEGAVVKIPFRDASGPILGSAGAPIVFEFPPKLMAALNMQAPTQGNAKGLQLLLGGGAALLLLVLAGVFLVMKRNSPKEADHNAETES